MKDIMIEMLQRNLAIEINALGELYGYIVRAVIGTKYPGQSDEQRELLNMLHAHGKIEILADGTVERGKL